MNPLGLVDLTGANHQHALCLTLTHHRQCIAQVSRSIRHGRRGWAHGAGHHHRFGAAQHLLQEPPGLFERVGTVGDDDATHLGPRQPMLAAPSQQLPGGMVHVLAVELSNLLTQQTVPLQKRLQSRHSRQQRLNAKLRSGVLGKFGIRAGRSGDGAACAQNHPLLEIFFVHHLHKSKNWSKIQVLDEKTDPSSPSYRSPPCLTVPNSPPASRKFWT